VSSSQSAKAIVLVGFMAVGKSTIGRLLATSLGWPFIDTDEELETAFGMPIAELFENGGESRFRDAERDLVRRLVERPRNVIAVGGGAFLDPHTREKVKASALAVWLDPPFEIVRTRLARSHDRPLAKAKRTSELRQLWDFRQEFYREAHIRVPTSDEDPSQVVAQILARLPAQ
jgi:shikimate kinase